MDITKINAALGGMLNQLQADEVEFLQQQEDVDTDETETGDDD